MSKANSWINGVMLQAISEKTGHPIVVFKENQFSWERFCFASRFSRGIACAATNCEPLVIILKKKHYSSLRNPIDVTCPKSWLQETAQVSGKIFVGAGKRPKSDATPSVKSFRPSTATNCDLVPVIARSVKSTNTPSIHTEASEATPSVHTLRKMASVAGHRSYKKQVSSGVTPSVHTLNLSAAYVGSCSTKASRPDFDPSDKKVDTDTSDPLVWTCRLCPGHTKFTAKSRPQLQWTRANHLKKRHPNRTEKMSDPLRKLTPAVIATDCLTYQGTNGEKSIKAHIQKEHLKKKMHHSKARWKNFRLDRTLDPIMDKSRSQVGKKLEEFHDNKPRDTNGHDIVKFTPDWNDLPKNKKRTKKTITKPRKGRAVTCTKCWRFQFRSSLQRGRCLGKVTPSPKARTIWLQLQKASHTKHAAPAKSLECYVG